MFILCVAAAIAFSSVSSEARASSLKIIDVLVEERGGRLDWAGVNNIIVHSRYGNDGYYDIWEMHPDGTHARCLTCDSPAIPQLHNGQPAWHPSGKYIIFQSQDPALPHGRKIDYYYTEPGHGLHNNLWITDPEGKVFYQLTKLKSGMALLHPCFSRDGSRLAWSERVGKDQLDWAIKIADFAEYPAPHLENIRLYQPAGKVWYETHQFTADGSKILCTIASGNIAYSNYDIWVMDIETQNLTQLTSSPDVWDEHAHYSPDGKKIVWVSSTGYPYTPSNWGLTLKTDLWIMDADGLHKQRITYFNDPGYPEYTGKQIIMSDNCWSPDGKQVAALIMNPIAGRKSCKIVIIDIEKALRRNEGGI